MLPKDQVLSPEVWTEFQTLAQSYEMGQLLVLAKKSSALDPIVSKRLTQRADLVTYTASEVAELSRLKKRSTEQLQAAKKLVEAQRPQTPGQHVVHVSRDGKNTVVRIDPGESPSADAIAAEISAAREGFVRLGYQLVMTDNKK